MKMKAVEVIVMEWYFIVALSVAVPVILFPAAFVWYLNVGGLYTAIKEARARKAAQQKNDEISQSIF
jgi:hypothetical protein